MKAAQAWFIGGDESSHSQPPSSLLADWNSYAAARSSEDASASTLDFDLESPYRSANDTVSGTFSVGLKYYINPSVCEGEYRDMSQLRQGLLLSPMLPLHVKEVESVLVYLKFKGVKGGKRYTRKSATSSVPCGKALMYFG